MKKLLALVLAFILVASVLCIPAFAATEEEPGDVIWIEEFDKWYYSGSMIGNGSLAMVLSILALAASVFSIFLTLHLNKKRNTPEDKRDEEDEDSEDGE